MAAVIVSRSSMDWAATKPVVEQLRATGFARPFDSARRRCPSEGAP
jgi:hypothetical protein